MNISACIIPDSAVLTLREEMPPADSCGGPFLEKLIEGLLAVGCGGSGDKDTLPYGSGDEYDDIDYTTVETTVVPSRTLSTPSHSLITQSTKSMGMGVVSITPNRSPSWLPPRFTPSTDSRQSSFQNLLRIHLNTFNQRLSMLEGNTLDMKESVRRIEGLQRSLGSRLKELVSSQTNTVKDKTVRELEKSYRDVEARLTRLEDRLEIMIDGLTVLAQELNKMKRTRQTFFPPQEKKVLPSLATVIAVPSYSTPQPPVRVKPTQPALLKKATVPKSIPTPRLPADKPSTSPKRIRKVKPSVTRKQEDHITQLSALPKSSKSQVSTSAARTLKTTLSKPRTVSKTKPKTTVKPKTKRPEGRTSTVTDKHITQPSQTRPKQVKEETTTITTFLEPSAHKPKAARTSQLHKQSDQANKKESALSIKNNGHNKTFSLKGEDSVKSLQDKSKKNNTKVYEKKNKIATTTTKASTAKSSKTRITPAKTKAAAIPAKKTTKKNNKTKKTKPYSALLDLLSLLKGVKSPSRKKNQHSSLHVVVGRLAIPIKIIPDD